MQRKVCAIAAMDEARVIGFNSQLPWKIPEDMKRFSQLTRGQIVLMGRKTYESLPATYRPLPERRNIIVSRGWKPDSKSGIEIWDCPNRCIMAFRAGDLGGTQNILWVIGGAQVYNKTVQEWDEVYLTLVAGQHVGDAFFPAFEAGFSLVEDEAHQGFRFQRYERKAV